MDIYGQLCGYCLATGVTTVGAIARVVAEPAKPRQFELPWGLTLENVIVTAVAIGLIAAAVAMLLANRQKKVPEDKIDAELERYAWLKKARKDKKLNTYKPFYASYNDARKGLVRASDVRFTCPALFDPMSQGASNANPLVNVHPVLPRNPEFQSTAYFAVIVTKEHLLLHFKYGKLSGLHPFTVPIALSEIVGDGVREGAVLKIQTNSGTIPLVPKCVASEFNEIMGLLMEGRPRAL